MTAPRCKKCKRLLRTREGLCYACKPRRPMRDLTRWYDQLLAAIGGGPIGLKSLRADRASRIPKYQARASLGLPLFTPPIAND